MTPTVTYLLIDMTEENNLHKDKFLIIKLKCVSTPINAGTAYPSQNEQNKKKTLFAS